MDLTLLSDANLLALWADAMTELKSRGVIRSANNPVADYAERLVAERLALTLMTGSNPGYDAVGPGKTRYQIKARRTASEHLDRPRARSGTSTVSISLWPCILVRASS